MAPRRTPPLYEQLAAASKRSPTYPNISLKSALARSFQLWTEVGHREVDANGVSSAWGTADAAGKVLSYISALREYGLTQERGRGEGRLIKVSDLARTLYKRPTDLELLRRAAFTPEVFRDLWEALGTAQNVSEAGAMRLLQVERVKAGKQPFTDSGAKHALKIYRDNLEYVGLSAENEKAGPPRGTKEEHRTEEKPSVPPEAIPAVDTEPLEIRFPLGTGREVKFIHPKNLSPAEIEGLHSILRALAALFESKV